VISPLSVSSGDDEYPDDERVKTVLSAVTPNSFFVAGVTLAESLGNARVNNVVLLGALSHFIVDIPLETWLQAVRERVPTKFADSNERAFRLGRESMQERKSDWASHA